MSANYTYITDTGTIIADTSTILADVQKEWTDALGANLDVDASTPQGTLIATESIARTSVMKNNADMANVINPDLSYGTFTDAVCALLGITRGANNSTTGVGVKVIGSPGTIIQSTSRLQTSSGDVFSAVGDVTIDSTGVGVINIAANSFGPIPLPTGLLTIIDGVIGWSSASVEVSTLVTLGTLAYTDPQLKNRRRRQLFKQGIGSSGAIRSNVLDVKNVTSCAVVENNTGAVGTINGVTFSLPSGMWVCVAGNPAPADVAQALYLAHQGGCPWDFGTTGQGVPVNSPNGSAAIDPWTGLQYYVKYTTPILYDAYVKITVKRGTSSASPSPAVQTAIINYANGLEAGEEGLVVGAFVSAYEMAGSVIRQLPGLYVSDCKVAIVPKGSAAPAPGAYVLEQHMNPFDQASLTIGNIAVTVI